MFGFTKLLIVVLQIFVKAFLQTSLFLFIFLFNNFIFIIILFYLNRYVDYCMHRVKLLQHFGVIPVLVFDGDTLPAKKHTEASRFKLILLNFLFFFFFSNF